MNIPSIVIMEVVLVTWGTGWVLTCRGTGPLWGAESVQNPTLSGVYMGCALGTLTKVFSSRLSKEPAMGLLGGPGSEDPGIMT